MSRWLRSARDRVPRRDVSSRRGAERRWRRHFSFDDGGGGRGPAPSCVNDRRGWLAAVRRESARGAGRRGIRAGGQSPFAGAARGGAWQSWPAVRRRAGRTQRSARRCLAAHARRRFRTAAHGACRSPLFYLLPREGGEVVRAGNGWEPPSVARPESRGNRGWRCEWRGHGAEGAGAAPARSSPHRGAPRGAGMFALVPGPIARPGRDHRAIGSRPPSA